VIVVDTSALMAILLDEPAAQECIRCLEGSHAAVSAGTLAEAVIVAGRRGLRAELERLVGELGLDVVPVGHDDARRVGDAYETWGKGVHRAGLNFGDCFAYTLAVTLGRPLLYVGDDFTETDVVPARP